MRRARKQKLLPLLPLLLISSLPPSLPPSLQKLRSGLHAPQALGRARRKKEVPCPGLPGKEGRREGGREGGRGGKDVDAWELFVCGNVCAVAVSGVYVFGEGGREGGKGEEEGTELVPVPAFR